MCCEDCGAWGEPDGVCQDCGGETVNGYSKDVCGYSPVICETCGCAPCDLSC